VHKSSRLLWLVLGLLLANPAAADPLPQIFPLEQVRPGQKGYGLTVFSGFKLERFEVEVIDVLRQMLPQQDIVLVRVDHPVLRKTGVIGGMSGSPIFIDGKLLGALAYGWQFAKEPICGVTPAQPMFDLLKLKLRGPEHAGYASSWLPANEHKRLLATPLPKESRDLARSFWTMPFPVRRASAALMLQPASIPLSVSGLSPEGMAIIRRAFAPLGLEPVQGGGSGVAEGPKTFVTGGALAVQLVTGDISMVGTGTVTWAGSRQALAFGHRMFNAGELYLPVATARIHHSLASVARSFKLASPARVIGSLTQDRQAGIVADVTKRSEMIPLLVTMRTGDQSKVFRTKLARHRLLTGSLVASVVASALSHSMSDVAHASYRLTTRIAVRGYPELKFVEDRYAAEGVRGMSIAFSKGVAAVSRILGNPFEPAQIEGVSVEIAVKYIAQVEHLVALAVSSNYVEAGSRINLTATFMPYGGKAYHRSFPLEIPASLAGTIVVVEVAGGASAATPVAPPTNLAQYLKFLDAGYPAKSLVINLYTPSDGLRLQGQTIEGLPPSVYDSLNLGATIESRFQSASAWRSTFPLQSVVYGAKRVHLRIKSEEE
jgi:hypothetical protein